MFSGDDLLPSGFTYSCNRVGGRLDFYVFEKAFSLSFPSLQPASYPLPIGDSVCPPLDSKPKYPFLTISQAQRESNAPSPE